LQHRRQHRGDGIDYAVDVERHSLVEAVEVDVADVERHVHAGTKQSEVDRTKLTFDIAGAHLQGIRLQHVGGKCFDVGARCRERIELLARARRSSDLDAGGSEPPDDLAADRARGAGDPRHLPGKFLLCHARRPSL